MQLFLRILPLFPTWGKQRTELLRQADRGSASSAQGKARLQVVESQHQILQMVGLDKWHDP